LIVNQVGAVSNKTDGFRNDASTGPLELHMAAGTIGVVSPEVGGLHWSETPKQTLTSRGT
jgi:hypothetical protein